MCHVVDRDNTKTFRTPKAYYIFYEYFYKAAVGDKIWKQCLLNGEDRIGNGNTEAFALLLLINNYKAWMYEDRKEHGEGILTEYDTTPNDTGPTSQSIVDILLKDQEIILHRGDADYVIRDKTDKFYKVARQKRRDWCKQVKDSNESKEFLESMQGETEDNQPGNRMEKEKNKRRKIKELKKYTGVAEKGKRPFRGWSDEGHKAFEKWTAVITKDATEGRYTIWNKVYRKVAAEKNRLEGLEQDGTAKNIQKYQVDKTVVWDL